MPSFSAEVTARVDVDFEVFCSCGAGLCDQSTGRQSSRRDAPQVVVEPCKRCLENAETEAAEKAQKEMQVHIDDLQALVDELRLIAA